MCLCSRKRKSDRQTAVSHLLIEWRLSDLNVPWGSLLFDTELQTLFLNLFLSKIFFAELSKLKTMQATLPGFYGANKMHVGLGSPSCYSVPLQPGFQTDAYSALCHH